MLSEVHSRHRAFDLMATNATAARIDRKIVTLDLGFEHDLEKTLKCMQQRWRGLIIIVWQSFKMIRANSS